MSSRFDIASFRIAVGDAGVVASGGLGMITTTITTITTRFGVGTG